MTSRINVYRLDGSVRLWLRVEQDQECVSLVLGEAKSIGKMPGWLEFELEGTGADFFIQNTNAPSFALENGLAPGQDFAIEFDVPTFGHDPETGICDDISHSWEVVYREPMSATESAVRWTSALAWRAACKYFSDNDHEPWGYGWR